MYTREERWNQPGMDPDGINDVPNTKPGAVFRFYVGLTPAPGGRVTSTVDPT